MRRLGPSRQGHGLCRPPWSRASALGLWSGGHRLHQSCRRGCVQQFPVLTQTCAPTPVRVGSSAPCLGPGPCDRPASLPSRRFRRAPGPGPRAARGPSSPNVVQAVSPGRGLWGMLWRTHGRAGSPRATERLLLLIPGPTLRTPGQPGPEDSASGRNLGPWADGYLRLQRGGQPSRWTARGPSPSHQSPGPGHSRPHPRLRSCPLEAPALPSCVPQSEIKE